jgi:CTP synthase (UTP-ammonia lyase)
MPSMPIATFALVGDRSPAVRAHTRIPAVIEALRARDGIVLDPYWIPSGAASAEALERFDGIWIVPGSPYRSAEGAIRAARVALEHGIPFLGTCGGFQHAVLMLARERAGLGDAAHAEYGPEGELVIVPLACSLVGHEGTISSAPGSRFEAIMGVERSLERYHCSYGIATDAIATLEAAGVIFGAHDQDGAPRALELAEHPFFLGTLFQPELAGDGTRAHPVIRAFAEATTLRAASPVA